MKVRFAVVEPAILEQVRAGVEQLQRAVDTGDMDDVDETTAHLLELTAGCRSIDLSEERWQRFLSEIRREDPDFESRYLLPGESCASLLPGISTDAYVLEIPMDDESGEVDV